MPTKPYPGMHDVHLPYIRRQLARGCTQRAVAEVLGISEHAVHSMVRRFGLIHNSLRTRDSGRPAPEPLKKTVAPSIVCEAPSTITE